MSFSERDFFRERFSEVELRQVLGHVPPSEVFAWRSPTARAMGLRPEEVSNDELVCLMVEEPRLIRRPLVKAGSRLLAGANRRSLEAFWRSLSP